jgi:hypothetical protein
MNITPDITQSGGQGFRQNLGTFTIQQHQFCAVCVKTRGTTFIDLDMGFAVTDYALVRLGQ